MKILLTGFRPFAKSDYNPSQKIVEYFQELDRGIVCRVLPVMEDAREIYRVYVRETGPDIIVNLGLCKNVSFIRIEKVALNILDYQGTKDNKDIVLGYKNIINEGPSAFISDIDHERLIKRLISEDIPARASYHAGTFICNMIFYESMLYFFEKNKPRDCIFIHIPYDTEYICRNGDLNLPHIPFGIMIKAVKVIIKNLKA